jgi:hypothetical protein
MRVLRISPAFFLFTLLMNPIAMADEASADTITCCNPSSECHWYCRCPGSSLDCPWQPPDQHSTDMSKLKSGHEAPSVDAENTEGAEGLIVVRASKCLRDKMAQYLLGNVRSSLKFEVIRF